MPPPDQPPAPTSIPALHAHFARLLATERAARDLERDLWHRERSWYQARIRTLEAPSSEADTASVTPTHSTVPSWVPGTYADELDHERATEGEGDMTVDDFGTLLREAKRVIGDSQGSFERTVMEPSPEDAFGSQSQSQSQISSQQSGDSYGTLLHEATRVLEGSQGSFERRAGEERCFTQDEDDGEEEESQKGPPLVLRPMRNFEGAFRGLSVEDEREGRWRG